jgi:hypothetical protein
MLQMLESINRERRYWNHIGAWIGLWHAQGISLTIEQYNVLLAAAPLLESELAKKNIQVVRPDYDVDPSAKAEAPKEEDQYEDDDEEAAEDAVAKVDDDDEEDEE